MGRRYSTFLSILTLSLLAASVCWGGVPDPALSTVPNVVGAPGGGLAYAVTIVGSSGPIDSANVTLVWTTAGDTATCWCPTQVHPTVTATTNASGVATFDLKLGGCLEPATIPGGVGVNIYVNSIAFAQRGQVSPDVVSTHAPPCAVALADAVNFTPHLAGAVYGYCYDLNSDLSVGLTDAVMFTPYAASAAHCP
jgi:hypothetical protein